MDQLYTDFIIYLLLIYLMLIFIDKVILYVIYYVIANFTKYNELYFGQTLYI